MKGKLSEAHERKATNFLVKARPDSAWLVYQGPKTDELVDAVSGAGVR